MTAVVSRNALHALAEARQAWERTEPQLTLDGWAAGLDEQDAAAAVGNVLLLEPVPFTPPSPGDGLPPSGTRPGRGPGLTAHRSVAPEHPDHQSGVVAGAAFSTAMEAGAQHIPVGRARLRQGA